MNNTFLDEKESHKTDVGSLVLKYFDKLITEQRHEMYDTMENILRSAQKEASAGQGTYIPVSKVNMLLTKLGEALIKVHQEAMNRDSIKLAKKIQALIKESHDNLKRDIEELKVDLKRKEVQIMQLKKSYMELQNKNVHVNSCLPYLNG